MSAKNTEKGKRLLLTGLLVGAFVGGAACYFGSRVVSQREVTLPEDQSVYLVTTYRSGKSDVAVRGADGAYHPLSNVSGSEGLVKKLAGGN